MTYNDEALLFWLQCQPGSKVALTTNQIATKTGFSRHQLNRSFTVLKRERMIETETKSFRFPNSATWVHNRTVTAVPFHHRQYEGA